ncbi:Hnh endonuclease, partial [Thalictrum thalictroides]
MSASPPRSHHSNNSVNNKEKDDSRPRFFDQKAKGLCWAKAEIISGRHPERWRKDAAGNVVCKRFCNCQGCLCFEYDHIVPFSKGGESTADNCQILQTRVNRYKSDKPLVNKTELEGFSCDVKFT